MKARISGLALALLLSGNLLAQPQRDPTLPPPAVLQPAPQSSATAATDTPVTVDSVAIIVRDGVPYLVHGTRLYAVGQKLDNYLIERISETEVWLRRGKELRKISRFGAIQRQLLPFPSSAQP